MNSKTKIILAISVLIICAALLAIFLPRTVTIQINGEEQTIQTQGWTVEKVLSAGGLALQSEDSVQPPPTSTMLGVDRIEIELARPVEIISQPSQQSFSLVTTERSVANILTSAGLSATAEDRISVNGQVVSLSDSLPYEGAYRIELKKAMPVNIDDEGILTTLNSSANTLGEALDQANIKLGEADRLTLPLSTALDHPIEVEIRRAVPLTIQVAGESVAVESAARSVGEALLDAGISLQGLDYSIPEDTAPIPSDGTIQLIHVREEINQTQTPIPFTNEYIKSDLVELDKTEVVEPGQFGLEVTRTRVRYEDGLETLRTEEITWIAKQPTTQKVGRGTQVVVRKMDTPQGEIEYWRTVNVYATSYSPCRSGVDRCYYGTSSGLPVQQGVIGVTRAWYNLMVGQRIYVPGYGIGTIADTGGGIPGKYWIDLGYTDDDYVAWYSNVTIYFLTPVPPNIPWILP